MVDRDEWRRISHDHTTINAAAKYQKRASAIQSRIRKLQDDKTLGDDERQAEIATLPKELDQGGSASPVYRDSAGSLPYMLQQGCGKIVAALIVIAIIWIALKLV